HLLAVERQRRDEAGVDRRPAGAALAVWPGHQHRAGAALPLRAALLRGRQPLPPEPLEGTGVRVRVDCGPPSAVDEDLDAHLRHTLRDYARSRGRGPIPGTACLTPPTRL